MRGLILNDEVRERIKAQVAWANQPENWYVIPRDRPRVLPEPPGDNPAYVLMLEVGYRVVYTLTDFLGEGKRFRHLSVSVEGKLYPNQFAVYTIAMLYGFTGAKLAADGAVALDKGPDWNLDVNDQERCVIVMQEIPPDAWTPPPAADSDRPSA